MGLDGISVNSLRMVKENTSKENAINADMSAKLQDGNRSINSLDKKGAIDTDDKENTSFFGGSSKDDEQDSEEQPADETQEVLKADFSNSEIYQINVEENSNSITIYNKQNDTLVQKISPVELSTLVDNLKNPGGIFVNKRI